MDARCLSQDKGDDAMVNDYQRINYPNIFIMFGVAVLGLFAGVSQSIFDVLVTTTGIVVSLEDILTGAGVMAIVVVVIVVAVLAYSLVGMCGCAGRMM